MLFIYWQYNLYYTSVNELSSLIATQSYGLEVLNGCIGSHLTERTRSTKVHDQARKTAAFVDLRLFNELKLLVEPHTEQ